MKDKPELTPEEALLEAFERSARIYCEKMGEDPDDEFELPQRPGTIITGHKLKPTAPRWHFVAIELHDLTIRLIALKQAVQPPKPARGTH